GTVPPGPGVCGRAGADSAAAGPSGADGSGLPVRSDGLVECPSCKWLGPADSVFCGGDCGRPLRGASA
ncbi:hypothetical protein GT039_14170, partial [Streptomyces sp. SID2955]|nr:hypothetical protein [Streptomyces sp. SID2955]